MASSGGRRAAHPAPPWELRGNQEDISQNLELTQRLWAWIGGYLYLCDSEGQRLIKFTFVISKTNGSVEPGSMCTLMKN
ncbi:hypothetical protein C2845_PM18G04640 [Panicum miliaceum]|uniref:Uncharacterized protein n=1 Tax=Panicum miliaceum TaxID=4540 RepID=A0A3L6PGE9_PANMI|nr:hypothetical protein C2845_PM18G04640 [Panicum miliaceum]